MCVTNSFGSLAMIFSSTAANSMSTAAWIPAEIRASGSKPACGLATEPAPLTTVATALRAAQYFSYRMMSASPLCLRARAEKASPRCFLLTAAMTDDIESRVGLRRNLARSFATRGPAPRLPTSSRTRPDACVCSSSSSCFVFVRSLGGSVTNPVHSLIATSRRSESSLTTHWQCTAGSPPRPAPRCAACTCRISAHSCPSASLPTAVTRQ
mmetsp:Transcript_61805/g.148881  ORF Transcript_61805/g.148881 Transcript_61805/m.148881 type:complete len:211 (-) Transcript_61805:210-842(-)